MTYYAVSKRFGEDLGNMYARKHGMSVVCRRLGWFPHLPIKVEAVGRERTMVLGVRDCGQLFSRAVEAPDVEFALVNGFSREGRRALQSGTRAASHRLRAPGRLRDGPDGTPVPQGVDLTGVERTMERKEEA
jgi:hypothetical protein